MEPQYKQFEESGYIFYINENVYQNYEGKILHYLFAKDRYNLTLLSDFVLDIHGDTLLKNRYGMKYVLDNFMPPEINLNKNMETKMITACKAKEIAEENKKQYIEKEVIPKYFGIANRAVEDAIKFFLNETRIEVAPADQKFVTFIVNEIKKFGYDVSFIGASYDTDAYIIIKWDK